MRQFRKYPIYVSGNTLTNDEVKIEIERRLKNYDNELKTNPKLREQVEKDLRESKEKYGKPYDYRREHIKEYGKYDSPEPAYPSDKDRYLEAIRPDKSPKAVQYENKIIEQLETIHKTEIGKLFFESFNTKRQLWITLLEGKEQSDCKCFATVDEAPIKDHVHMKYPIPVASSSSRWYRTKGEDILFHEIVHAYRHSWARNIIDWYIEQGEYILVEEFVATLFQNIYLSCIGEQQFYRYSKVNLRVLTKNDYYDYLGSNVETFKTLKFFLEREPLSIKVARWAYPNFNPLRDYSTIKKIFYNNIRKK